ncbi:MAG: Crp/Fnr family transcriptional regulator [Sphingobacterium sp.]
MDELLKQKFREKLNSYYPISEATFQKLLNMASIISLKKNEELITQGMVSRQFCFLYTGYMIAHINDADGHSYNKNIFVEGDWVGSTVSNITRKQSEFTIKAVTNCLLVSLPYSSLRDLIFHSEDLKLFYIHYLEQNWIIEKEKREVSIVMDDAPLRYEKLLNQHPDMENYVPLQEIASHLGITPTQLSRIRKKQKYLSTQHR